MSKNEFTCDCTVIHEEVVKKVKEGMLEDGIQQKTADFFKILGDMTRVKIIYALKLSEMCVCDIANLLSMSKSAVSHQLATLRKSNFVICRREGKTAYYSLSDKHIEEILALCITHIQE